MAISIPSPPYLPSISKPHFPPMARLLSAARWWLVDHPTIAFFEWNEHQTWASSPKVPATAAIAYLLITYILRCLLFSGPGSPPHLLRVVRFVSPLHNVFLFLLSLIMAAGCSLASAKMSSPSWILCFPAGTAQKGPVFFWAYVFYLSKIYEFIDTFLILLAVDKRRLSFLHIYHHAAIVGVAYQWLSTPQSLLSVGVITNASVHVMMYAYYLSASLGWRWSPRWKKTVTSCQIVQFWFSFAVSLVFFWLHFFETEGKGCSGGIKGWAPTGAFNASLLVLFFNFHRKNYGSSKAGGKAH